jgi:hypothetical protein
MARKPRPTLPQLRKMAQEARQVGKTALLGRLTKILWLRGRQDRRAKLRIKGIDKGV